MVGGETAAAAVEGGGGGGGEEKAEYLTLRMALNVLVVEGDDSTRRIIAALLRKCGYRVSTTSDGLGAWEILKERSHGIDLVLTEVELPTVSGFVLLCMIKEHYTCKHIPVIMMSSLDSVSVVFKCILKGAADFLIKPIRKNELTNLWQHVWKGRWSILDLDFHDGNPPEGKLDASMKRNTHNCSLTCTYISEKTSDAQSSSAKSEMVNVGMHMPNIQDSSKTSSMNLSHLDMSTNLNKEDLPSNTTLVMVDDDDQQDNSTMLGSEANPSNEICSVNYLSKEGDDPSAVNITLNKDSCCEGSQKLSTPTTSSQRLAETKKYADLLSQATNNQQQSSSETQGFTEAHNDLVSEKDIQLKLNSTPIEPSLGRQDHVCFYNKQNEYRTLTHSDSSAFSLYTRTDSPILLTQNDSGFDHEKSLPGRKPGTKDFGNDPHSSKKDHGSNTCRLTKEAEIAPQPIRIVPVHVPMVWPEFFRREMPPLGHSLWGNETAPSYDEVRRSSSRQAGQEPENAPTANQEKPKNAPTADSNCSSGSGSHNKPTVSMGKDAEAKHSQRYISSSADAVEQNKISADNRPHLKRKECGADSNCSSGSGSHNKPTVSMGKDAEAKHSQRYISSSADGVEQNKISADNRPHLKRKECGGSLCCINNGQNVIHDSTREVGNDANVPLKVCLNQREAALIKFRLKRKDRCYTKTVRYKSRKILAEQRPRVKGQFVRQIRPNE